MSAAAPDRGGLAVLAFTALGPPIGLLMFIALAALSPIVEADWSSPGLIKLGWALPVLLIPAYLLGAPAAAAAGMGVVILARRGRGRRWTTPLLVGLAVGVAWCALILALTVKDSDRFDRMARFAGAMLAINVLATIICWRLSQRWLSSSP